MKPFRISALYRRAFILTGLTTLSFGSAHAADFYWDGTATSGTVTNWRVLDGWSTVLAGGTTPAALPGQADVVILRAANIKTGALTINMDDLNSVQSIKTTATGSPIVYSQEAVTTVAGTTGFHVLELHAPVGIDHAAGGITLGTAANPLDITIHSAHHTWNSNVVGGTAPGAAALVTSGTIGAGIGGEVTLSLTGQNTGTTINSDISNGIATNLNVELVGTASSIWTFNGMNTYTGTTKVNSGTLRITRMDALNPDGLSNAIAANNKVSVETSAILALRVGPTTFTADDISYIGNRVNFKTNAILALDTINAAAEVNGGLSGPAIYRKVGANPLILNGPNSYTSTTGFQINEGNLAIRRPTGIFAGNGTNAGKAVVGGSSALLAIMGTPPNGFTDAELPLLQNLTTVPATANIGISTAAGDYTLTGGLFGARTWIKGDPGTLTLLGNRSDTADVTVTGGTLRVVSLPPSSGSSPVGNFSTGNKVRLNGGRFMYAGPALTTDRTFAMTGNGTFDSSGSGPTVLTGTAYTQNGTSARILTLTGYAPGDNRINGVIANAGGGAVGVTKQGTASWTLAGTNTHTGVTRNNGGLLTLDYSTGGDPISTGAVHLNAGELRIKAAAGGTTETFSAFQLSNNQHTFGLVKFEGKVNLTTTSFTHGAQAQRSDLIDISSNLENTFTIGALGNTIKVVNGVLVVNTSGGDANGRANIILRDKDGTYGFPTLSGGTTGNLIKATLTNLTAGAVALDDVTKNYRLTKGTYTASSGANQNFSTVTLDSTAATVDASNTITLNLNGGKFAPAASGKGILVTGNNDVTIRTTSTNSSSTMPIWFHNYLEPNSTFRLNTSFDTQYIILSGSGFTDFGGSTFSDNFFVHGSLVRISATTSVSSAISSFRISAGGVLEVGEDFYSIIYPEWDQVDLLKTVGSATGAITFYGDSGLSAYASNTTTTQRRVVHFANVTGGRPTTQDLTWGAARFLTQPDSDNDGDYTFKLSSAKSNVTLEFRNNINLNGRSRNIEVANGTADIDGRLTGVLSGSDASGIIKSGAGTLQLTGDNSVNGYKGETRVQDGVLMVGATSLHPSSKVAIITPLQGGNGILNVTGVVTVSGVTIDGVAQLPGRVPASSVVTGTGELWVSGEGTPYQRWAIDKLLGTSDFAGHLDVDKDGLKNVIEYAVGGDPKSSTPSPIVQVTGKPSVVRFNRATTPVRSDLDLILEASTTLGVSWDTIATSVDGGTMTSSVGATVVVSESAGTVTVTDNRFPTAEKIFYRLRGELE